MKAVVSRDTVIALLLVAVGAIGLLDTIFGEWRRGPGGGPKLFPQVCYIIFIASGLMLMIESRLKKNLDDTLTNQNFIVPATIFFGAGSLYFYLVLHLGLVTTTLLYSAVMFSLLSSDPRKARVYTILASLFVAALIWLLFARIIQLILPNPLLF